MSVSSSTGQDTALVGVDWGTSSLRLVAMNSTGQVIAELDSAQGISRVAAGQFDETIESALKAWNLPTEVPLILSGMIGSRNGWIEAPYISAPLALSQLAGALATHRSRAGRSLSFVPGVKLDLQSGQADVMRGEETELLGWFELNASAARPESGKHQTFVLPGTHSKWVDVAGYGITHFRTCMTGEIFATLCEHSILGRLMESPDSASGRFTAGAGFTKGARIGLDQPQDLLANLFSVRALPLLELMPSSQVREYLAGLLIGSEVAGQANGVAGSVIVIGRGELADRYVHVLELAGLQAQSAAPGNAVAGQLAIAREAGLISR